MVDMDENGPGGELNDSALWQEIELLGELMATVAHAGRRLGQSEIDRALDAARSRAAA